MNPLAAELMSAWFDLCHRAGVGLEAAVRMGDRLATAYAEPERHYHTLHHVGHCLSLIGDAPLQPADRVLVELALWFHDAVYDPRRSDNEERSATMAAAWLDEQGVAGASEVRDLVLMTAGHAVDDSADLTTKVVHDVDLAILGADPPEYREYAAQIRQEYGWLSDDEFRAGRTRVLQSFLDLDRIYVLASFSAVHEEQARANLASELEELVGGR